MRQLLMILGKAAMLTLIASPILAQQLNADKNPQQAGAQSASTAPVQETAEQRKERMRWFTEARFGMCIHWSPACVGGGEISWEQGRDCPAEG